MKKILVACLTLLLVASASLAAQNANNASNTASPSSPQDNMSAKKPAAKRGPVFRATKEQIKQAQALLKGRSFYAGEETGKLDDDTRAGLKKYQEAESLKVTGTLNKATLEKMSIALTDKQKEWKPTK